MESLGHNELNNMELALFYFAYFPQLDIISSNEEPPTPHSIFVFSSWAPTAFPSIAFINVLSQQIQTDMLRYAKVQVITEYSYSTIWNIPQGYNMDDGVKGESIIILSTI